MANTTYVEDLTITGLGDVFTRLTDEIVAKGWTRFIINDDLSAPVAVSQTRREHLFRSPGDDDDPGGFYISIIRQASGVSGGGVNPDSIRMVAMTSIGTEGVVPIDTVSRSGTTFTVTTTVPHGFETGDLVRWGGTSIQDYNRLDGNVSAGAMETITRISDTEFTQNRGLAFTETAVATGGAAYKPINIAGDFSTTNFAGIHISPAQPAADMELVFGVDEFAIAGEIIQNDGGQFFYLGATGRGHIPLRMSAAFTATAAIVGAGAAVDVPVNETIDADTFLLVGQPIDIYDNGTETLLRTQVRGIGPGNQLNLVVPAGVEFRAGATIAWDPFPIAVIGPDTPLVAIDTIESTTYEKRLATLTNGSRPWAQNDSDFAKEYTDVELGASRDIFDNASDGEAGETGNNAASDIYLTNDFGAGLVSRVKRGPLRNCIAVANFGVSDFKFAYSGNRSPEDVYKIFARQPVQTANDVLAIGPNVPNAPPIPIV